jgi:archaellum component FlaC
VAISIERLRANLGDTTNSMIGSITEEAERAAETLKSAGDMLRGEVGGVLGNVQETNAALMDMLSRAGDSLSTIESGLANRTQVLESIVNELTRTTDQTTGTMVEQVTSLRGIANGLIRDVSSLTSSLDTQGQALAEAANSLSGTHDRMEESLDSRRVALEHLSASLSDKAANLDGVLRNFTRVIDDSLGGAEERARDVAASLAAEVSTAVHAVHEQFERVRTSTVEERERTAVALRAAYEQAIGDMTSLLRGATDNLSDIARQMRGMTSTIHADLENTREELKNGVLMLPKETEESTNAIRRVVTDQIKALNALTDIASRGGKLLDISEPKRTAEYAYANESRAPAPSSRMESQRPSRRSDADAVKEAVNDSRPAGQGNWLSGLLARASNDETSPDLHSTEPARNDPTVRTSIESLDSLSVDIARMIDHQAVMDLWDRYRKGERNVFTRKLYTLQGQQAFDDISQKYGSNREFQQTVNRYINEFEHLLDEVSRNDRDGSLASTYLTSETGKVYTMLAHVTGRFDNRS